MPEPTQLSLPMARPPLPRAEAYLVVDLETTCSQDNSVPRGKMETIEIGAVLIDGATLAEVDRFQSFVRPEQTPKLTPFCTELTHITQAMVDEAPDFTSAFQAFKDAVVDERPGVRFCSWTPFDKIILAQDCRHHEVPYGLPPHLDLKAVFASLLDAGRTFGLRHAMDICDLAFEGTQHRGIDDAINTARLLPFLRDPTRLQEAFKAYKAKPRAERRRAHARRRRG